MDVGRQGRLQLGCAGTWAETPATRTVPSPGEAQDPPGRGGAGQGVSEAAAVQMKEQKKQNERETRQRTLLGTSRRQGK